MGTEADLDTDRAAPGRAAEVAGPAAVAVAVAVMDRAMAGTATRTVTDPPHPSRCTCARSSRPY